MGVSFNKHYHCKHFLPRKELSWRPLINIPNGEMLQKDHDESTRLIYHRFYNPLPKYTTSLVFSSCSQLKALFRPRIPSSATWHPSGTGLFGQPAPRSNKHHPPRPRAQRSTGPRRENSSPAGVQFTARRTRLWLWPRRTAEPSSGQLEAANWVQIGGYGERHSRGLVGGVGRGRDERRQAWNHPRAPRNRTRRAENGQGTADGQRAVKEKLVRTQDEGLEKMGGNSGWKS